MTLTRDTLTTGQLHQIVKDVPELEPFLLSKPELQASIQKTLQQQPDTSTLDKPVWIFAYGSLIWNPIIQYDHCHLGKIHGWHRRFCMKTPAGRGTSEKPGLALALERGGSCRGVAYRIPAEQLATELLLLWRREMVVGSYIPRWIKVVTEDGPVDAIAFTMNPHHPLYVPGLSVVEMAAFISSAQGPLGSCADYLLQTIAGLAKWGITDQSLIKIRDRIEFRNIKTF
ncbi:MAG: gamma-glutamylcyclotransferase [Cyanobacteria bacterium P01_F01_bin.4]